MDNGDIGNREKLLEALDVTTARMIRLAVVNTRPGVGPIIFICPCARAILSGTSAIRTQPGPGKSLVM